MPDKNGQNRGRPTKYNPEVHIPMVEASASLVWTNTEIAEKMKIAVSTFNLWKKEYPEFSDAVERGKQEIDRLVENALFKRTQGYEVREMTGKVDKSGNIINPVVTVKHVPSSVAAQKLWLCNRKKMEWQDKQHHDVDARIVYETQEPDELKED